MKLSELLIGTEILETNIESFDIEAGKITVNSKEVKKGDVFISLVGQNRDGHGYIGEAINNRAAVIIIERKNLFCDFPYIRVVSTRKAYSKMWNNFCRDPSASLKLIAVTGTNGKSTVVSMITHILNSSGIKAEAIGTLNSSLTTPDPPELYPRLREMVQRGVKYAVLEASSHALELDKLAALHFEIAIFTNLTRDHLDYHKSMYRYAKAKSKLFEMSDVCLYNYDDKYSARVTANTNALRYSYSLECTEADFCTKNRRSVISGSKYDFLTQGELFPVAIPLAGSYNIVNSLCAASCARLIGIENRLIRTALKTLPVIPGRMERVEIASQDYSVFIDYAHTPDALAKVLGAIKDIKSENERLVCIFGCGGDRDKGKRAPMGKIASELSDRVVITSDNSRSEDPYDIIRDILDGVDRNCEYLIIADRKRAIQYSVHSAKKGDILVFCGKGHENYEINNYGKTEFNEKQIIQEADKERIRIRGNEYYSCRQNEDVFGGNS